MRRAYKLRNPLLAPAFVVGVAGDNERLNFGLKECSTGGGLSLRTPVLASPSKLGGTCEHTKCGFNGVMGQGSKAGEAEPEAQAIWSIWPHCYRAACCSGAGRSVKEDNRSERIHSE